VDLLISLCGEVALFSMALLYMARLYIPNYCETFPLRSLQKKQNTFMNAFIRCIVLLLFTTHYLFAQDTITKEGLKTIRTPHTFSSPIPKNNYDSPDHEVQVCKACHGPDRNELVTKDSLFFNIKPSKSFYELFGHYAFSNCAIVTQVNAPDGISSNCLTCHDASVASDRVYRQPGGIVGTGALTLMSSHPISFVYDTASTEFWPITHKYNATNTVRDLLDENFMVQCTSCHTMHGTEFPHFLRTSNENSELCIVCHKR
jgi:predicted CXXCH cytochrome family protein